MRKASAASRPRSKRKVTRRIELFYSTFAARRASLGVSPGAGQTGQVTASEPGVDGGLDRGGLFRRMHLGLPTGHHSTSADGRDVVAAGLAVVVAVNRTTQRVGQERAIDDQFLGLRGGELAARRRSQLVARSIVSRKAPKRGVPGGKSRVLSSGSKANPVEALRPVRERRVGPRRGPHRSAAGIRATSRRPPRHRDDRGARDPGLRW